MIQFILGMMLYSIGEGITEALTWYANDCDTYGIDPRKYHIVRLFEMIGIIIMILNFNNYNWIICLWICSLGLSIYQMVFSIVRYADPLYNKTSKWLGIPHPGGFIWMISLVLSVLVLIHYIII